MGQAGHQNVPLAKAATFIERGRIEDMPAGWGGNKAGAAVGPNKDSSEEKYNRVLRKRGRFDTKGFRILH